VKLRFSGASAVLAVGAIVWATASPAATPTAIPALWKNCKHVNVRYPHGVGRMGAHDETSGTPVTNFKHSTFLYRTAMRYSRGLDRDKDGIACEKL
jgi:Excalibur calcium-binding domain